MVNRQGPKFHKNSLDINSNMTSKTSARLKAGDQAFSVDVAFSFIMTDEGPELIGEEELTTQLFDLFEEKAIFEAAKRVRMRGHILTHRSTRSLKIEMQEVFETLLPPNQLPLGGKSPE